ncbi:MAG: sulfatase [Bryobacterales bacterium]|nr:sulfatase [Bryobacterales bacterium]
MKLTRRSALTLPTAPFLNLRAQNTKDRLNVLWILGDDLGPQLGCYGHPLVHTPHADRIASEGVRFTHCFTTAPVCSASRSGWNTGVYQTTTGTHNHRSHRKDNYHLPEGVRLISHRMRDAGYFTANVTDIAGGVRGSGKTDFNFKLDEKPFQGTHWNQRAKGQPFYAQINFTAPHKGPMWPMARKQPRLVDPAKVELPPYYPDHPVVRDEVANYLDAVNLWDMQVGAVLDALKRDGVLDNTVIFVFGDNGRCLLRGKQWLYDPGTQVPLLVRWPGVTKPGTVRKDPAIALDITATTMDVAGIEKPALLHGQSLFAKAKPRGMVFTARDRCDMTVDRIRAVRDGRYKLIRNFLPDRPYTQFNEYITNSYPTQKVIKELHASSKLNAVQAQWMAERRPDFELYDLEADPHEVNNLASKPEHKKTLDRLSKALNQWIEQTNDQGRIPESRETIDAEEPRARKSG